MNYDIQFLNLLAMAIGGIIVGIGCFWRLKFYKVPIYVFALTGHIYQRGFANGKWRNYVLNILRFVTLAFLIGALGRPQMVDTDSQLPVQGADIVMALDVSFSMKSFDDPVDRRSRIEVAVEEAKKFVDKRENDQIGLVLFAADSVARLPLSIDKNPIKDVLNELEIGILNPQETFLMAGIATAVNRLRHSKAKSKVIIVLTDGAPTIHDFNKEDVMEIVKKVGAKIYAIGIGSPEGGYLVDEATGVLWTFAPGLNEDLLKEIAQESNGRYFAAQKPEDMKKIYETIDRLEKTEIESPLYRSYFELGIPLVLGATVLFLVELLLRFFLWKIL